VIEQLPAARNVAVVPDTVQMVGVVDAKLTARPELAVAESVRGVPTVCAGIVGKVMVWEPIVAVPFRAIVWLVVDALSELSVKTSVPVMEPITAGVKSTE